MAIICTAKVIYERRLDLRMKQSVSGSPMIFCEIFREIFKSATANFFVQLFVFFWPAFGN